MTTPTTKRQKLVAVTSALIDAAAAAKAAADDEQFDPQVRASLKRLADKADKSSRNAIALLEEEVSR